MGNLSLFLKSNKKTRENVMYPATASLCGQNGDVLKWEIRPLTTEETEKLREECTTEVPITGKPGVYRPKVNSNLYVTKLLVSCVVFPDLYNKELQDSYGVKTPEALLKQMIDNPAEYNAFAEYVQNYSGLNESVSDKVDKAKN